MTLTLPGPQKVGDYSAARPGGALLRSRGYVGMMRYAAHGRDDINISRSEVDDLLSHGIAIGIVNEHTAEYMLTFDGHACALQAQEISEAAGLPQGIVFFAGDFDATNGGFTSPGSPGDQNMTKMAHFLTAAAGAIGELNIGFYGSYFACYELKKKLPWLFNFWATEAWSHGLFYAPAKLYQYAGGVDTPGVDKDAAVSGYWGQRIFLAEKLSQQVLALPVLHPGSVGNPVRVLQTGMNVGSGAGLAVDGVYGPSTRGAVLKTQGFWHLSQDGVAGPQTDRVIAYECSLKGQ